MVVPLPMYRVYGKACKAKRYSMSVAEGMFGEQWGCVRQGGVVSLLSLPDGVEMDMNEVPEAARSQFVGEYMADMMDNFI